MRIVDNNTVELGFSFTEPDKSTDGSALTDLDYSTLYIITPAGTIKAPAIQESSASGGADRTATVLVDAPMNAKTSLRFAMTSTDTAGNEGPRTPERAVTIDRIAPEAPSGFSIA